MKVQIPLSEAAWQKRITDLAAWLGLRWFHSGDSRRDSCAGFPDLVICGPRGVLYVELKTERGRVSNDQWAWLNGLAAAGADVAVWRPSDWDEAQALLRRMAGKGAA